MRIFVGLSLPESTRALLTRFSSGLPGATWVDAGNLHMTLRFIGEVSRGDADDLHHALSRIDARAFSLVLSGAGCFQQGRKVHTLWVGAEKEERLIRLQEKIESAVVRAGCAPERRKFKAHVTLARFRKNAPNRIGPYLEAHAAFRTEPFPVACFTLFRSHLGNRGAHYQTLADYPLIP